MSQNPKKALSAGHDYTSEDAPHTDRIIWYITQTLIQLADTAYKQNPKPLIAYLTENYNANNNTNIRAPKGYARVWREPLLFRGFGGGEDEDIAGVFARYLSDDSSDSEESMVCLLYTSPSPRDDY